MGTPVNNSEANNVGAVFAYLNTTQPAELNSTDPASTTPTAAPPAAPKSVDMGIIDGSYLTLQEAVKHLDTAYKFLRDPSLNTEMRQYLNEQVPILLTEVRSLKKLLVEASESGASEQLNTQGNKASVLPGEGVNIDIDALILEQTKQHRALLTKQLKNLLPLLEHLALNPQIPPSPNEQELLARLDWVHQSLLVTGELIQARLLLKHQTLNPQIRPPLNKRAQELQERLDWLSQSLRVDDELSQTRLLLQSQTLDPQIRELLNNKVKLSQEQLRLADRGLQLMNERQK